MRIRNDSTALVWALAQVSNSVLEFGLYPGGSAAASNDSAAAQAYAAALQSNATFREAALLPRLQSLGVSSADMRVLSLVTVSAPEVVSVTAPAPAFVVLVRPGRLGVVMEHDRAESVRDQ